MSDRTHTDHVFNDVAEAMILLDTEDHTSVAELAARVDALAALFTNAPADHPINALLGAMQRVRTGDLKALGELETQFSACRARCDEAGAAPTKAKPATKQKSRVKSAPTPVMPLAGDEELVRDFAIRSSEHLDDADERLLALEAHPGDAEAIDAVFRAFHTIKGMAGFLALDEVSDHAHASENLLADARATGAAVDEGTVGALFAAVDRMRELVAAAAGLETAPTSPDAEAAPSADADQRPLFDAVAARAGTVRVEEARLDALLDTIGELVIAESMVSASGRSGADTSALEAQIERLDKITRELQQMATSLRMVPLRATFRRMARLVRDVAAKADKQVELVLSGEDTELDKVVVDRIGDPLIHALRNAVDHGIESAEERVAQGKPATGRVELRAYHAGGAIHVDITDDGRGLDPERILAKARERGIVGTDERLDERGVFDLVFAPGFSTAEQVTDVSGRGVGMDVVKRTVEELRGRVELRSVAGAGTTLSIRLPLTLAIIDGMVLRVGDERYVLPLLSIERSVRPTAEQLATVVGRGEMLTLDEGLVPIVPLHRLFSVPGAQTDATEAVVVIVDDNGARAGLLACELLGQQQTVIKPLGDGLSEQPGISGGAILPDGRVGLILDAAGLVRSAQNAGGE